MGDIEKQMKTHGLHWPCLSQFRDTLTCLQNNNDDLNSCKETVEAFFACTDKVEPLGFAGRCKNILVKNRFISPDDYTRPEDGIVKQGLEKVRKCINTVIFC